MMLPNILLPRPRKLYNTIAARCRPVQTNQAEIREVLMTYDLGEVKGYQPPAIHSSRSRNLILDLKDGQRVLKQYKSSMSLEGITYEHSVLKHLADNGFPSPRLIPNREGATCVEVRGKYYALFDFVPGFRYTDYFVPASWKKLFRAEAGKTLAHYHQIMEGFVPAGRKLDGFTPDGQRRWLGQSWYLSRFVEYEELFKAKDEKSKQDQFFADNLDRLRQCYVSLSQRVEDDSAQLPKVINHGDYGPHNLFFDKRGLVAVLDFECVHFHLRAKDVINALQFFAGREVGLDYYKASDFLGAYFSSYPLTVEEIEMIPDVFRLIRMEGLVYYFRDYFDSANLLKLHYAWRAAAWVDWVEKNADDLVEALLEFKTGEQGSG